MLTKDDIKDGVKLFNPNVPEIFSRVTLRVTDEGAYVESDFMPGAVTDPDPDIEAFVEFLNDQGAQLAPLGV